MGVARVLNSVQLESESDLNFAMKSTRSVGQCYFSNGGKPSTIPNNKKSGGSNKCMISLTPLLGKPKSSRHDLRNPQLA